MKCLAAVDHHCFILALQHDAVCCQPLVHYWPYHEADHSKCTCNIYNNIYKYRNQYRYSVSLLSFWQESQICQNHCINSNPLISFAGLVTVLLSASHLPRERLFEKEKDFWRKSFPLFHWPHSLKINPFLHLDRLSKHIFWRITCYPVKLQLLFQSRLHYHAFYMYPLPVV